MTRILILFAHPTLEKSRIHRRLLARLPDLPGITLHDLYEAYPDYDIDVPREQALLESHDLIVFQHPFFWYSSPPLLKQWIDLVLEHGWAYGSQGTALRGKAALPLLSAGGGAGAYTRDGYTGFTVRELLVPFERSLRLCGVRCFPPYVVFGAHALDDAGIEREAIRYADLLARLHREEIPFDDVRRLGTLNEAVTDLAAPESDA